MVKLPSSYLKKAIDRDFAESELAQALGDTSSNIRLKAQTLGDLQAAIDKAEGEVKTELRHQFLAEKQEFIKLMGEQQELRRKQVDVQIKLYERLLDKLDPSRGRHDPGPGRSSSRSRKRPASASRVRCPRSTWPLFGSPEMAESKYSRDYAKKHGGHRATGSAPSRNIPMTTQMETRRPGAISKQDYLRHLIAENQAVASILDQEEQILGYMAKLVALDAMGLSEEVAAAEFGRGRCFRRERRGQPVSSTVDFFITQ